MHIPFSIAFGSQLEKVHTLSVGMTWYATLLDVCFVALAPTWSIFNYSSFGTSSCFGSHLTRLMAFSILIQPSNFEKNAISHVFCSLCCQFCGPYLKLDFLSIRFVTLKHSPGSLDFMVALSYGCLSCPAGGEYTTLIPQKVRQFFTWDTATTSSKKPSMRTIVFCILFLLDRHHMKNLLGRAGWTNNHFVRNMNHFVSSLAIVQQGVMLIQERNVCSRNIMQWLECAGHGKWQMKCNLF